MNNETLDTPNVSEEQQTTEVTIIDLDKLDDNTDIDYDKISQEESMTLELNNRAKYTAKSSNKLLDRILNINWHLILLIVFVFAVIFIIYRFKTWGTKVDLDKLGTIEENSDIESEDIILPLAYEGDAPALNDGIRKVVLLGNDTFAQNKGTSDDMANMIAELSDATVYNCAVSGSSLASTNDYINPESDIMDAFNLYWLTTAFTLDNMVPYEALFKNYSDKISPEAKEAFETLRSIDFDTVDVIGIMYDANDYLAGKPLENSANYEDIHYVTGNLAASIDLIQQYYPHIRIIVMSPAYAYAVKPNGDYVSSELYCYIKGHKLSLYALLIGHHASSRSVTFVDNFYGTINEINADQYLLDHINLNVEGRKKLAERFVYALTYYDEKEE